MPGSVPDLAPVRICPTCRRRVPRTIAVCRCGTSLQGATVAEETGGERPRSSPDFAEGVRTAFAIVGALAMVISTFYWLSRPPVVAPQRPPQRPLNATPKPVQEPVETAAIPPPPIEPPVAPAPAPVIIETRAPDAVSLEDVVSRVMPAVVLIEASGARGSGFFVAPDTLLTNVHVIGSSSTVTLKTMSGASISARVAATSLPFDIAVLKVSSPQPGQATIPLGANASVRVGEEVLAIGSALGTLQNTVTRGIVSGIRQSGNARLVQTDAAINPGNSGGPLLDRNGTAIGIATMGYGGLQGLNFAVSIEHARPLLDGAPAALSSASTGPDFPGLTPAVKSDTDRQREEGLRAYERALEESARRAESFDDEWARFRQACYSGSVVGVFDHEWLALLFDRALPGLVAPQCGTYLMDFRREAAVFRDAMLRADEAARQAGLYPGVRRDARRKYRLDSDAWDR